MNPSLDLVRPPFSDWKDGGKLGATARHSFRIHVDPNAGYFNRPTDTGYGGPMAAAASSADAM